MSRKRMWLSVGSVISIVGFCVLHLVFRCGPAYAAQKIRAQQGKAAEQEFREDASGATVGMSRESLTSMLGEPGSCSKSASDPDLSEVGEIIEELQAAAADSGSESPPQDGAPSESSHGSTRDAGIFETTCYWSVLWLEPSFLITIPGIKWLADPPEARGVVLEVQFEDGIVREVTLHDFRDLRDQS